MYISYILYIYIYREREREKERERARERETNHDKKTTYLENIFDSRLHQFIASAFLLKSLHKIFFTIFTVGLKEKVKML